MTLQTARYPNSCSKQRVWHRKPARPIAIVTLGERSLVYDDPCCCASPLCESAFNSCTELCCAGLV